MNKGSFNKKKWFRQLALAVTAGLITGAYVPAAYAAEYNKTTTGISVDFKGTADSSWLGDIVTVDSTSDPLSVKYTFDGNNTINVSGTTSASGISILDEPNVTIDVKNGGTLKLVSNASVSGANASASGLSIAAADGVGANVTVNGNLDITAHSKSCFASGISVGLSGTGDGGEAHLTVNGNVTMRDKNNTDSPWGVTSANIHGGYGPDGWANGGENGAPDYTGARWAPSGIYLNSGYGSTIDINGDVDLAIAGSAVVNNNYYDGLGTINLNGGKVTIDTPESTTETYYALANYGGIINVNMNGDKAGTNDVKIKGNIITMKEDKTGGTSSGKPYYYADGKINLALSTANSSWTGIIDNSGAKQAGEVNLFLQNGAQWDHKSLSKKDGMQVENMPSPSNGHYGKYDNVSHVYALNGGATAASAGYILQNDTAKIAVDNYSGNTVVIYKHDEDGTNTGHYIAGDTIIKKAAAGSGIVLSTDNTGITMTDDAQVKKVLNALAGKLYYEGYVSGENNLSGLVQIASGLTSSSTGLRTGNISYDASTGQGSSSGETTNTGNHTMQIIEDNYNGADNIEYWKGEGVRATTKAYTFDSDTTLNISSTDPTTYVDTSVNASTPGGAVAAIWWNGTKGPGTIDMKGHKLSLNVNANGNIWNRASGIKVKSETLTIDNAGGIDIVASNGYYSTGIDVTGTSSMGAYQNGNGDAALNINNDDAADHAVKIRFENTAASTTGINVAQNSGTAHLNITGLVDIEIGKEGDTENHFGLFAMGADAKNSTASIGGGKIAVTHGYALSNYKSTVLMNAALDEQGMITATSATRDVQLTGDIRAHADSPTAIAMNTANSYLKGVAERLGDGQLSFILANGAKWDNTASITDRSDWTGSSLYRLVGGEQAATAGNIFQNDKGTLSVDNYSGYTNIYYAHDNSGEAAEDYKAGNTIIKNAAAGSNISMITDNSGITMDNTDQVNKVLNALAGKLVYEAYTKGEKNLTGKVKIADGLTASSGTLKIGDIDFGKLTGQGSYNPNGTGQNKVDFTTSITGSKDADTEYVTGGVLQDDGSYKFTEDSNITIGTDSGSAIDVGADVIVDAKESVLNLASKGKNNNFGIKQESDKKAVITANKLVIKAESKSRSEGIHVMSASAEKKAALTINGDVDINSKGVGYALGIYAAGNGVLDINGNVTMKGSGDSKWGVDDGDTGYQYYGSTAIYAGSNYTIQQGPNVNINGNVDLVVNGNGAMANGGGSAITLKGGSIEVNSARQLYALLAQSGYIDMNMNEAKNGAGTDKVNIKGNIGVLNGSVHTNEPCKDSIINLGLSTADSTWTGVIDNNFTSANKNQGFDGTVNLYMSNGATWTNEAYGITDRKFVGSKVDNFVGGSTAATAGNIFQKDTNKLTLNNYSGYTNIYYAHDNSGENAADYKAGDTVVKAAAAGSGISMITDNTGITVSNTEQVHKVLNALAGKLTYAAYVNGEKNLDGKVVIASGLTSSSASMKTGKITFDDYTGKGSYEVEKLQNVPITGSVDLTQDEVLTITKDNAISGQYAGIFAKNGSIDIDLAGNSLEVDITGDVATASKDYVSGIAVVGGKTINIKNGADGKALTISAVNTNGADSYAGAAGIATDPYDGGNAKLNIDSDVVIKKVESASGYAYGVDIEQAGSIYNFNKDLTITDVSSAKNKEVAGINVKGASQVNVLGNINIANVKGSALKTQSSGSAIINIAGGTITAVADPDKSAKYLAAEAKNGVININQGKAPSTVNITGDMALGYFTGKINLNMQDAQSSWTGALYTSEDSEAMTITMGNGATWTNERQSGYKTSSYDYGSEITNFTGGSTAATAGNIFQKDSNKITLGNYSGYTNIYYAHDNSGEAAEDYKAGDTIVKAAAADSGITMITDNSGIIMSNTDQVNKVLNALAGKLTYAAYVTGEKNLTGKVSIADGLTASGATLTTGDIAFNDETGKGGYEAETLPDHQIEVDFTTAITGDKTADQEYLKGGVLKEDGSYEFTKDSNITIASDGGPSVEVSDDVVIKAAGSTLNLNNSGKDNVFGIKQETNKKAEITADKVVIKAESTGRVEGIHAASGKADQNAQLTINGDVDVNAKGVGYALGMYAAGNGIVDINGNVTMKGSGDSKWGVDDNGTGYAYYGATAIYAGADYNIQKGGTINVNGNVDLVVNGNGAFANGGGSTINLKGGSIEINSERQLYALLAQSGYIDMNMNEAKDGAGTDKVNIKGNIGVLNGSVHSSEPCKDSIINLGLSTADSTWTGVIDNNFTDKNKEDGFDGKVNLYMSNGAAWTNEAYGVTDRKFAGSTVENFVGGSTAATAGNIFQKDTNKLTFNNYSGYTNIYYAHDNSGEAATDYKAGDTIVKKAATGSGISMITDNSGITITDTDQVNKVLNALAGKLTYEAYISGEKNLAGKVSIADGLTASGATLSTGDITFNEETGKGGYEDATLPDHQIDVDFTTAITGDKTTDKEYLKGGVLQEDGTYKFTEDSNITIASTGSPAIDVMGDVVIDAAGSSLTLKTDGTGTVYGISQNSANKAEITADKLTITTTSSSRAEGIHMANGNADIQPEMTINGNVEISATGTANTIGAYIMGNSRLDINGDLKMTIEGNNGGWGYYGASGLYATSNMGKNSMGATINVSGNVDIKGNANGIFANAGGSVVTVGGGRIEVDSSQKEYAAIRAEDGKVNMNVQLDKDGNVTGAGTKDVNIKGNIAVTTGAVNGSDKNGTLSQVNLGLTTKNSTLNGVIYNAFPEDGKVSGGLTFKGEANLWLQNGASWTNEVSGKVDSGFAGSKVDNFVGGSSAATAGNIFQKDTNKLTLGNYSGYTNIYYAHENAGAAAEDYKAGDTIVKNAAKGSSIAMITDNSGIDMTSTKDIEATLSALAKKLQYANAANDENLDGKVQIADGLTSSSIAKQVGNIKFDTATGEGSYETGSVKPGGDSGDVIIGDYESDIMKGARSAMMTSMMTWRDNAADIYSRAAEIRSGAEEGIWVRTFGGKTKYSGNKTDINNSYWAGQIGWDKQVGSGWTLGAAFDYRDGNASYLNGGKGDNKLYSLGAYATKDLGADQYLDIAAKIGQVKNDYQVYNIIGQELKGDYSARGYSLSAQYSKRLGDAKKGYVEPQVQLTWSHVDGKTYDTYSGNNVMNINQDGFNSFVGRLGVAAGVESERGSLFARLSLAHEFAGDSKASYNANDGGAKTTEFDLGGTWSELTVGGSYKLSSATYLHADLTRSLSGDFQHQWKLNAGINFSF